VSKLPGDTVDERCIFDAFHADGSGGNAFRSNYTLLSEAATQQGVAKLGRLVRRCLETASAGGSVAAD
jgi:hypothetical protein